MNMHEERLARLHEAEAQQFGMPVFNFERELANEKRKTYINGMLATAEDLMTFEYKLRAGLERATGEISGNCIYYKTI